MIVIKYNDYTATFDGDKFISSDIDFELMLNNSWEDVDLYADSFLLEGGIDGIALKMVKQLLGDGVKVISSATTARREFEPEEIV